MKKVLITIILALVAYIIYFLQSNFFNWFTIAGIKPNLFILLILFIGLFGGKTLGTIYGVAIGLIIDLLLRNQIGITAISLGIVGFLSGIFDKNFSKDSRITIMVMTFAVTIISELISYLANYFIFSINFEIMAFIKITLIETIYNLMITIIIYPLFQKFGYNIENEFKESKILTRYF